MKLRRRIWMLWFVGILALWMVVGGVLSVFDEGGVDSVATPSPTRSPRPTATPKTSAPCETEAAVQYMAEMQAHLDDLDIALQVIGFLSTEAGYNPELLLDGEWQDAVALHMIAMGLSMMQIEAQTPPPVLAGSHNLMLLAFNEYHLFIETYTRGINDLDDVALLQSQTHVENALAMQAQAVTNRKLRCNE